MSSSSSSSQSLSSSSSSSLPLNFTEQINQIIAGYNPDHLIPFSFQKVNGFAYSANDQQITFSFKQTVNEYFNYSSILSPPSITEDNGTGVYVPQEDDAEIKHEPIYYVDLIVRNTGVKSVSVRSQEEKYQEEAVTYSFIIPKFSWNHDLITASISSNVSYTPLEDSIGSFWAGTLDEKLYKIEYAANVAASAFSTNGDGVIKRLVVDEKGNELYTSTDNKLKKYLIDHYMDSTGQLQLMFTEEKSVDNVYKIISSYQNHELMAVLPERGTLQQLDENELSTLSELNGFDAPFKVIKSSYHNCYFVAGTHIVWKVQGSNISSVYALDGFEVSDIATSENGELCITFTSPTVSYFRILDSNLYRLLVNERITDGQATKCVYCSNQYFYALTEINLGGGQFKARNYMYNTVDGSYTIVESQNVLVQVDDSPAPTPATKPIEIEYPNGGESIALGSKVEILWKSTKSVTDTVSIELYKSDILYKTIVSSTPNTGVYEWTVSNTLDIASTYKIKIKWLAAEVNPDNEDISLYNFNIVDVLPSSSVEEVFFVGAVGVDYDKQNNQVVIVLENGLIGFLKFDSLTFHGWINSGIDNYTSMIVKNEHIKEIGTVSKIRVFVGSQPYLSDMWDSGIVETNLSSIYYGGGDNLVPGETYYVNIQVYSEINGWSTVQTRKWIMPKR